MSITVAIIVSLLLLGLILLITMSTRGGKITEYFKNAVRIYLYLIEPDARLAALAAAKVATKPQREEFITHLKQQLTTFELLAAKPGADEVPIINDIINRLEGLAQEIMPKNWTVQDIRETKKELGEISPQYLNALERSDPQVFMKQYPTLFQTNNILALCQAVENEMIRRLELGIKVGETTKKIEGIKPEVTSIANEMIEQAKESIKQAKKDKHE